MALKVGINGFGRIGRNVLKGILQNYKPDIEVVAINDLTDPETCAHLFKYDSIYGVYPQPVDAVGKTIRIDSQEIRISACKSPEDIPWGESDVDVVVESTGRFCERDMAEKHFKDGIKKVIISAPAKGDDVTIVPGVNEEIYVPDNHHLISCASCTTNCVAQVVKIINDYLTIQAGTFCTIHAYSNDQSILDQPHPDLRRGRALSFNTILTTTGAANAVGRVIPEVKGKLHAIAYRVPVHCGSLVDCTFITENKTTKDEVNNLFIKASEGINKGFIGYSDAPLVSIDFKADPRSAVVDGISTAILGGNIVRIVAWYDNEWSYSMRVCDLIAYATGIGYRRY